VIVFYTTPVDATPEQLHRAVRNLVDNAVRHARRAVTISVVAADGHGQVLVGNDGPPIAAGDRSKIFDRFVRLDDSRSRQGGGAGLGLPIARDIIHAHGGTITVDDRGRERPSGSGCPWRQGSVHRILSLPTVRSPDAAT
jgi:signal transduction histidine kinase